MNNILLIDKVLHYQSRPGSRLNGVVKDLLQMANLHKTTCVADFNDVQIKAKPGGDADTILNEWQDTIDAL